MPEPEKRTRRTYTTERKKRSDAKRDIKVKLSFEEKKMLQRLAVGKEIEVTAMASIIIEKQLSDLQRDFKDYEYEKNGVFVHVLLDDEHFKIIQNLSIEWGFSVRKTAFKLMKNYLATLSGGFIIHDYRRYKG